MAWQRRGRLDYYYRTVRCGGKVRRLYFGPGVAGKLAANLDARGRAERKVAEEAIRAGKYLLAVTVALASSSYE